MNWVIQTDSFTIWKPEIQNQFHCDKTKVSVGPCSLQRLLGDSVSLPYQFLVQHVLACGPFLHLHGCSVASTDLYPLASSYNFCLLCQMFFSLILAATAAKSLQSCPTLCDPRDRSPRLHRPWNSPGKDTGVGCHFLLQCMKVKSESKVAQSCPPPSDPMDCSLPGSSVHGIFQARVLEWGAIAFSSFLRCLYLYFRLTKIIHDNLPSQDTYFNHIYKPLLPYNITFQGLGPGYFWISLSLSQMPSLAASIMHCTS